MGRCGHVNKNACPGSLAAVHSDGTFFSCAQSCVSVRLVPAFRCFRSIEWAGGPAHLQASAVMSWCARVDRVCLGEEGGRKDGLVAASDNDPGPGPRTPGKEGDVPVRVRACTCVQMRGVRRGQQRWKTGTRGYQEVDWFVTTWIATPPILSHGYRNTQGGFKGARDPGGADVSKPMAFEQDVYWAFTVSRPHAE